METTAYRPNLTGGFTRYHAVQDETALAAFIKSLRKFQSDNAQSLIDLGIDADIDGAIADAEFTFNKLFGSEE